MLNVKSYITGPLGVNTYLGYDDTKKAFIVDPGGYSEKITDYIRENGLEPEYIILTHGHADHIGGVAGFKEAFPRVKFSVFHASYPWREDVAGMLHNCGNVYADLSGLIEGPFRTEEFMEREKAYTDLLKLWIRYVGDCKRFMFGTDWPAVDCVEYGRFIAGLFREDEAEHVMFRNALEIYNIKEYFADERPESK